MASDKHSLFQEAAKLVIAGKYIAAARAFRTIGEYDGFPLSDCSVLFDAMLCPNAEEAGKMFRAEACKGNKLAACCNFLSWLDYSSCFVSRAAADFDIYAALECLEQAKNLCGPIASKMSEVFFADEVMSKPFRAFKAKLRSFSEDPEALRILGDIHLKGISCPVNEKRAAAYYKSAAEKGNAKAMLRLGLLYLSGAVPCGSSGMKSHSGASLAMEQSLILFKSAAAQGLPEAFLETGKAILSRMVPGAAMGDAVPLIEKAAELGSVQAWRILGKMYFYGLGKEQNRDLGLRLMERSYIAGDPLGTFETGLAYYYHGPFQQTENMKRAFECFSLAASRGIAEAWKMTGRMFFLPGAEGKSQAGTKKDDIAARKCFEMAVEQGCLSAMHDLAELYYDRGKEPDFRKAFELFAALAETGYAPSQYRAALMLRDGIGTEENMKKACELLCGASGQGYAEASYQLFEFALRGFGSYNFRCFKSFDFLLKALREGSNSAYLFIRNGRKSDHFPVMLKELFFENFLCNMKRLLLSGKRKDSFPFFLFALANAELLVPVKNLPDKPDTAALNQKLCGSRKEMYEEALLEGLGRAILGTGRMRCSAVLAEAETEIFTYDFSLDSGQTVRPEEAAARKAEKIFPVFSCRSEIPASWLKKYRFLPIPAARCFDFFLGFMKKNSFPYGIVLDPLGSKPLFLRKGYAFLLDNLPGLEQYYRKPSPEQYRW